MIKSLILEEIQNKHEGVNEVRREGSVAGVMSGKKEGATEKSFYQVCQSYW